MEKFLRFRPLFLLIVCIFCAASAALAQDPRLDKLTIDKPRIDKIDPPNWWAALPDPVLLVHGEHLDHTVFSVEGKGVHLALTQVSENGHWAFLNLQSASAAPQTLQIIATNAQGTARHSFALAERSHDPRAHAGFSAADTLYLIMTDRFADGDPSNDVPGGQRSLAHGWHGGDLAGIRQHIDYLKQLGVTAVWTTPVASQGAMPDSYHGYAATDLYAVDPHFGSLEDYRQLSAALHANGIKLVNDLVPNHLGVLHPWVLDPPAPEWFHGTLKEHTHAQFDFAQLVDPHAPQAAWRDITAGWFTDAMPDLNQENPLVSQYLIQNALWWIETANLDGIRLDTFPFVGRAFWHDFHEAVHKAYPQLTTVGEVYNGDPEITSFFAGGVAHRGIDTGLDTPFDFPVYFKLRDVLAHDKPMTDLARVLRQDALYPHPERLVPFIGNHDTKRFLTDANGSVPRLKLALGLLTTLRGMPQIYSGDEIAMQGGDDPDNRRDFPGGFPGDAHSAFTQAGRTSTENEVFDWTSGLLKLRATYPALQTGQEQNLYADNDAFAFVRTPDESGCSPDHSTDAARQRVLVIVNKAKQGRELDYPVNGTALAGCTEFKLLTPASVNPPVLQNGKLHITEPAESMLVVDVR
jgi:glycosidase